MSPRWNCWPTTAAGSITARPRGPSRSRRASSKAWMEVGTVRDRRSAASSDSTASVQRPSAVRSRPSSLRLVTSSSTSSGKPWAHSLMWAWTAWSTRPPSRWTTSCSPSRSGRGRAGTTARWPSLLASGRGA